MRRGATTSNPAVVLERVGFSYAEIPDEREILREVTLAVPAGGINAILGPNGVGKTTLLSLILGWLTPRRGRIALFGESIVALGRRGMGRTVSLLPQDEHIAFEYRLIDYVLLARAPYLSPLETPRAADRDIAYEALERVGMVERALVPITEVSGGEKQLVMLARCLAQQPRLLLMDEPTAHLDLFNKRRLVDLLHSLRDDGVTTIFSTHDPEFASICADRLILLHDGGCPAHGPTSEVMREDLLRLLFDVPLTIAHVAGRPVVMW